MRRYGLVGMTLSGLTLIMTGIVWVTFQEQTRAHCQVPCSIYDDGARVSRLREDATTIAKAIAQINELAGKRDAQSLNQATRWVATKEAHASHIIEVVAQYFLTQRVKAVAPGDAGHDAYLLALADHHAVMVAAMKTKQKADAVTTEALSNALDRLASHYKK